MVHSKRSAYRLQIKGSREKEAVGRKPTVHPDTVQQDSVLPDTVRMDICSLIGELYFRNGKWQDTYVRLDEEETPPFGQIVQLWEMRP